MKRGSWALAVLVVLALAFAPAAGGLALDGDLSDAIASQERHTPALLAIAGVVGTGVSLDADGHPELVVLAGTDGVRGIPSSLDGFGVRTDVTGPIWALHHREGHEKGGGGGDDGVDTTQRFPRPIPIGVSTGNEERVGLVLCTTGTYGARVLDATTGSIYALSNNHVYAHENQASIGSAILQPGPADTGCATSDDDSIGSLSAFVPLQAAGNTVDAAIAISDAASIGTATPADGYGTPTSAPIDASVGLKVQKYGRTTKLTTGVIDVINLTVVVQYLTGPKVFEDQIGIEASPRNSFLESGDSGSLVVSGARDPVGLAFAGNEDGSFGIANRIDLVLEAFGVTIDGQ